MPDGSFNDPWGMKLENGYGHYNRWNNIMDCIMTEAIFASHGDTLQSYTGHMFVSASNTPVGLWTRPARPMRMKVLEYLNLDYYVDYPGK